VKLLLDEMFSPAIARELRARGHDVESVSGRHDWQALHGLRTGQLPAHEGWCREDRRRSSASSMSTPETRTSPEARAGYDGRPLPGERGRARRPTGVAGPAPGERPPHAPLRGKGGIEREVAIPGDTLAALEAWLAVHPLARGRALRDEQPVSSGSAATSAQSCPSRCLPKPCTPPRRGSARRRPLIGGAHHRPARPR